MPRDPRDRGELGSEREHAAAGDLVGLLAAADFADDVEGLDVGLEVRLHLEAQTHLEAAVGEALDAHGVFGWNGGRRDLRDTVGVVHATGVRRAQARRTHGAHQRGHGAMLRGHGGAARAVRHGLAVVGIGHVEQHDFALGLGRSFREFIPVGHHHDLGLDAVRRRGDAAAESDHRHDVMRRVGDLQALDATHPFRHHHAFGVDIFETVFLHGLGGPRNGAIEIL